MKNLLSTRDAKIAAVILGILIILGVAGLVLTSPKTASAPIDTATTTESTTTASAPTGSKPAATAPAPAAPAQSGLITSAAERVLAPNGWDIAFVLPSSWKVNGLAGPNGGVTTRIVYGTDETSTMVSRDQAFAEPTGAKPNTVMTTILGTKVELRTYSSSIYFTLPYSGHTYYFRVEGNNATPFISAIEAAR